MKEPSAALVFKGVEAESPEYLGLNFSLDLENPFPSGCGVSVESWRAEINGREAAAGFSLNCADDFSVLPGSTPLPLRLDMDVAALARMGLAPADDYEVNLITVLRFSFDTLSPVSIEVSGLAVFPGVQAPTFTITEIAILKAELINTRFRVGLRIDNPNAFPVELSKFNYVLYGNSRLWADGTEKNIIKVNGKSSLHGNLFLIMNFIDMPRDLLNQIIALADVNYRFTGEATVGTGVEYLSGFGTGFDLSGYSKVYDN
jgi:LEA14-like dessication related protein